MARYNVWFSEYFIICDVWWFILQKKTADSLAFAPVKRYMLRRVQHYLNLFECGFEVVLMLSIHILKALKHLRFHLPGSFGYLKWGWYKLLPWNWQLDHKTKDKNATHLAHVLMEMKETHPWGKKLKITFFPLVFMCVRLQVLYVWKEYD